MKISQLDVNELINEFKIEKMRGKSNKEILDTFDELCDKDEPTITDGIKMGYLYGWVIVASEGLLDVD
jgi:hypothetical protein